MTQILVRFAPSPTGKLHVGSVRPALLNWLFARKYGGQVLLRIDDTDAERSREEFVHSIEEDLHWLGLDPDLKFRQSERLTRYQHVIEEWRRKGRLYPCYETPEELALKRKHLLARKLPPIYDRAAWHLSLTERQKYEAAGRKPHWRFYLEDERMGWEDLICGSINFSAKNLSDPILVKEDGCPVYTLASIIDDADYQVTHIIRGADHISNTAIQIQLWKALGYDPSSFQFGHFPKISNITGEKLSKRIGGFSIETLREQGIEPMALCSLLAKIGTSQAIEPRTTLEELVEDFDITHISTGAPRFDIKELHLLNQKLYSKLSFHQISPSLEKRGIFLTEELWEMIRDNIQSLPEVKTWVDILRGEIAVPKIENLSLVTEAIRTLPRAPWTPDSWETWVQTLKKNLSLGGGHLFPPLRRILTGLEHGPELQRIFLLMGRDLVLQRLQAACQFPH